MFLLLLIAPKQKNFCVTKDRVPLRGSAVRLAPALFVALSGPAGHLPRKRGRPSLKVTFWLPRVRESWHRVRKRPVTERAIAQRPNGFIADCMVMLFFTFFPLDSGHSMVYITL